MLLIDYCVWYFSDKHINLKPSYKIIILLFAILFVVGIAKDLSSCFMKYYMKYSNYYQCRTALSYN